MKSILSLLVAAQVAGESLVILLPSSSSDRAKTTTKQQHGNDKGYRKESSSTNDLDFGRQLYAKEIKHHGLFSDRTGKLSHKLDQSKIGHKMTAFQTGLVDFDNPLEDIFASKFHATNTARRLGKASKSKSSKSDQESIRWESIPAPSNWYDGTISKSKSKSKSPPVWSGWHTPSGHDGKSSKSKSSKSENSAWSGWHAPSGHGLAGKGSKKSKSSAWNGSNASTGGGASFSSSKSSKGYGLKGSSFSFDFSYQIGSYGSWSIDESRDSTPPELLRPPVPVKTPPTSSPVSAKPALKLLHVESNPRADTMLVSELSSIELKPADTHDVSGSNEHTTAYESLRSNKMYFIAGAALFGGLVTFFAAVVIKRKVQSSDTHIELKEPTSQDDTEDTTPSDRSHSYNLGTIQHSTSSENYEICEWSHPDSWLAVDMRA
jgi:hypothetical protein